MNLLPPSTIRLIASSQVITSVSSVVKELVENSLDAGATSIEVKLDGWGLERIEVRDNGCGVKPEDAPFIGQPHYTSKISSDGDLKSLSTYGFRGEALGSLSMVSSVSILTKTESEQVGMLYTLDRSGKVEATQPKPAATGTTIIATNLFKNLPVRKQFSSHSKKCRDELKKVEDLLMAYGLVHPSLRILFRHNKAVVWQKNKVSNHRTALVSLFGTALLSQMGVIEFHDEENSGIHVLGYLPKSSSDLEITGRAVNDRCFVFFNGRPVNMKQISQLIKQYYNGHTSGTSNRYPVAFLNIQIPPESVDVNLEPNKTSVMLTNKDELITLLTNLLDEFYSDKKNWIPDDKTTAPGSHGGKNEDVSLKNGFHVNDKAGNGEIVCVQSSNNICAVDDEFNGVEVTSTSSGNIVCMSKEENNKGHKHVASTSLDKHMLFENTQRQESIEKPQSKAGCHLDKNALSGSTSNKNDLLREDPPCQEGANPDNQGKALSASSMSPSLDTVMVEATVSGQNDQAADLPSAQQDGVNALAEADSLLKGSSDSTESCEELSDKTLCEMSESGVPNVITSSETENGTHNSKENSEDQRKDNNSNGCSEKNRSAVSNGLKFSPSIIESVEKIFSLDMDDLCDDSNLNVGGTASNNEMLGTSSHCQIGEKSKSKEIPSSASNKGFVAVKECLAAAPAPVCTEHCSDKDWSMGRGIVDKQGNAVEPVTLLTPGSPLSMTPITPLCRKRKQPSDKSRLSLSSKKIKKTPEDYVIVTRLFGCITSAESVLITQQSQEELYKIIANNKQLVEEGTSEGQKVIVVSVSPQSRASVAAKFRLSVVETAKKLTTFLKDLGVHHVFDTTFSRDFSLAESQKEFIQRLKSHQSGENNIPMLASACPGWVCYAEKTHGNYILPYISTTKSPQQIMGSLVKNYFAVSLGKRPNDIYHVTIMPCYDKKLEASREDFYNDIYRTRDVDCVISTLELEKMFEEKGVNFTELENTEVDRLFSSLDGDELVCHSGGGSGGYLEHIFSFAAKELFGKTVDDITYKTLRNKDFKEVTLEVDGKEVLKFAAAYGFRNIQNLVQKIKRGKSPYHFVEVMACPSGCLSGGGQIRPDDGESSKELINRLDELYNSLRTRKPNENPVVEKLYKEWLDGESSDKARQMLHTKYHEVEKLNTALNIKW